MSISVSGNKIQVPGKTISMEIYHELKNEIEKMVKARTTKIEIDFIEAMALPSATIGNFIRTINVDSVYLIIGVKTDMLFELLEMMNLTEMLHVKRI